MAVVINEFEVVPASEPAQETRAAARAEKPASAASTPEDIGRALRHACERAMRLRAH